MPHRPLVHLRPPALLLALAARGLEVTVARPFNVLGPGQSDQTPAGEFARAVRALSGPGELRVRDSSLIRDFVSLGWVASVVLALARVRSWSPVVNLCSGRGVSFAELIEAMAVVHGVAPVRIVDTAPGGLPRVVGDPTLLQSLVGEQQPEGIADLARTALEAR